MGKQADPGMAGSLLYHMAMVTKMESETQVLLDELKVELPNVSVQLGKIYCDFESDAKELTRTVAKVPLGLCEVANERRIGSEEKIALFNRLKQENKKVETQLNNKDPKASEAFEKLFGDWAEQIIRMRLIQEYETIKGLLVTAELAKTIGLPTLEKAMARVQEKFGQETVSIALDVTLKVGMRREKLQSVMLSDHFINMTMSTETLDGKMEFLNCPIYGSHKYATKNSALTKKFRHCSAPISVLLTLKPCSTRFFHFRLHCGNPNSSRPTITVNSTLNWLIHQKLMHLEQFVPLVMSWNVTRECNMKCSHCYINATEKKLANELTTQEGKNLMDQICKVSKPLLILSGGEPLLRPDIYELIEYGASKGLKMGLGSNGSLIDDEVAHKLKAAGIATVSISLDSHIPAQHDEFRGVVGAWEKAVNACKALRKNNVLVQVNTTLTQRTTTKSTT